MGSFVQQIQIWKKQAQPSWKCHRQQGSTQVTDKERNPLYTTTYGVGQMIVDAIHKGCRRFIMGIGGSATNDGGVGMLQALGYDFLDKDGNQIKHGAIGLKDLVQIKK